MGSKSFLDIKRFEELPLHERVVIGGCERTAHDCAYEALIGCRDQLPEKRAIRAAIAGVMTALCRIIAECERPDLMMPAVQTMMDIEVEHWIEQQEAEAAA